MTAFLKRREIDVELPLLENFGEVSRLLQLDYRDITADWGHFSVERAVERIGFLIETMIKIRQLSSGLSQAESEVQLAFIQKDTGFHFVPKSSIGVAGPARQSVLR